MAVQNDSAGAPETAAVPLSQPSLVTRPYISADRGPASSGGASQTQMVQITCADGTTYEAHAKFAERAENGKRGLASELLVSALADLIGAYVPSLHVVDLPEGQVIKLRDGSCPAPGLAAASETIEPWIDVNAPDVLAGVPVENLAMLSVLQCWTESGDRGHNMIKSHDRAFSIDHVSAFNSLWSGTVQTALVDDSLLHDRLAGEIAAMRMAIDLLANVRDRDIDAAVGGVPDEWMDAPTKTRFRTGLLAAREFVLAQLRLKFPQP